MIDRRMGLAAVALLAIGATGCEDGGVTTKSNVSPAASSPAPAASPAPVSGSTTTSVPKKGQNLNPNGPEPYVE
jgi:hypothetical protein